ncbi:hypothetical protein [Deinococcus roseus]|uniref:Uncharacterized protein n=1 Tax=Deinococcus roseus TaxID=392414 RepID=A0ABQ2CY28_9DEIO|nr:hypothetical protein [Deinococcus roseus]GGJ31878.1 hypothetical protein GCM10008938_17550 [Deinococcus roseus]
MAISTTTADTLPGIQTSSTTTAVAPNPENLNVHSGSFSLFGPLSIHYTLDLQTLSFSASLVAFGVQVAEGDLSVLHPTLALSGNYHIAKWDLNLALDESNKKLDLSGDACLDAVGCKTFDITLLKW